MNLGRALGQAMKSLAPRGHADRLRDEFDEFARLHFTLTNENELQFERMQAALGDALEHGFMASSSLMDTQGAWTTAPGTWGVDPSNHSGQLEIDYHYHA